MSQETIRKLAVVMSLAVRKEVECGSARLLRIQHSLEKELAPFGALLEIAELRTDCLNKPMRTGCNCYGCRTRAALSDIQKQ